MYLNNKKGSVRVFRVQSKLALPQTSLLQILGALGMRRTQPHPWIIAVLLFPMVKLKLCLICQGNVCIWFDYESQCAALSYLSELGVDENVFDISRPLWVFSLRCPPPPQGFKTARCFRCLCFHGLGLDYYKGQGKSRGKGQAWHILLNVILTAWTVSFPDRCILLHLSDQCV